MLQTKSQTGRCIRAHNVSQIAVTRKFSAVRIFLVIGDPVGYRHNVSIFLITHKRFRLGCKKFQARFKVLIPMVSETMANSIIDPFSEYIVYCYFIKYISCLARFCNQISCVLLRCHVGRPHVSYESSICF